MTTQALLPFLRFAFAICAATSVTAGADDSPLWDLSRNDILPALRSGAVEKVDGAIKLSDGAAFAVPPEAFPDQANFTVQVTLSLDALVQDAVFTAMRKQSEQDDGFSFCFNYRDNPYYSRQVNSVVNNILMTGGSLAERLLRNLLNYATPDLAQSPVALPADFDQQLKAIGYQ